MIFRLKIIFNTIHDYIDLGYYESNCDSLTAKEIILNNIKRVFYNSSQLNNIELQKLFLEKGFKIRKVRLREVELDSKIISSTIFNSGIYSFNSGILEIDENTNIEDF